MNLSFHLRIVGLLLILLGLSHAFFNRYFDWQRELASVSLLTRRIFFVHTFFIAFGVALCGVVSLVYAGTLLHPGPLNRAILAGMASFWFLRLGAQFFAYDSVLWRGDIFRTRMHIAFCALWIYVSATYLLAFVTVCAR